MEKNPGMSARNMATVLFVLAFSGEDTSRGDPQLLQNISPSWISAPQRGHAVCLMLSSTKVLAFDLLHPHL